MDDEMTCQSHVTMTDAIIHVTVLPALDDLRGHLQEAALKAHREMYGDEYVSDLREADGMAAAIEVILGKINTLASPMEVTNA